MTRVIRLRTADRAKSDRPPAGWYQIATTLRPSLEKVAHGDREQTLKELAADYNIKPDTLRRFIAAANFLDHFHDLEKHDKKIHGITHGVAHALREEPAGSVELIARWFGYDRLAASAAAKKVAQGHYTVAELRSAERAARVNSKVVRGGRAGAFALRHMLAPKIHELIEKGSSHRYTTEVPGSYDPKGVDFLFKSANDPTHRIAVLIFGPFKDQRLYFYREDEFLLKILGLSRCYSKVIGIVPKHEEWGVDFKAWLEHFADPNITFHYLDLKSLKIDPPL